MTVIMYQDRELKKPVGAIHVSGRLSLVQRKAINVMMLNAENEFLSKDKHRIPIKTLMEAIGFNSHNREALKDALRAIMTTLLEWNLLDANGKEKTWEAIPTLSYVGFVGPYCVYAFPDELKPRLHDRSVYALISLRIQRRFSSGHALTLYENAVRFRHSPSRSSGWWTIKTLRKIFGVDKNPYYDAFKRINAKIVQPAVAEVNANADIHVAFELRREGKRVTAIRFLTSEPRSQPSASETPLLGQLRDFGLTEAQAREALTRHDATYITENLEIVANLLQAGRIRSTLAAATVDALNTDYRRKRAPLEVAQAAEKEASAKEKAEKAQRRAEAERKREREIAREAQQLDEALAALSPSQRQALEGDFAQSLENGSLAGASTIRSHFKKRGFASKAIQAHFRAFAREKLLVGARAGPAAFTRFRQEETAAVPR